MTCGDAGFAARAAIERNLEGVLLAGAGFGKRNELPVMLLKIRRAVVNFRKAGDGCLQAPLLCQELVNQGDWGRLRPL